MKVASIHRDPRFDVYEYEQPPSDDHVYDDEYLHPFRPLVGTIHRREGAKWVKTGKGPIDVFFDAKLGLARIKAVDERLHLKVHAYFGHGHPLVVMPSNSKAFVTKLWSSTLDRNRAFFCISFDDAASAGAFQALFESAAYMSKLTKHVFKEIKFSDSYVSQLIAGEGPGDLVVITGNDDEDKKTDADDDEDNKDGKRTEDDEDNKNDEDDEDGGEDEYTDSGEYTDDDADTKDDEETGNKDKENYLAKATLARIPRKPVFYVKDDSSDDDSSDANPMVDKSQALVKLNLD